jgi:small-conductance mechanosensitive channel
MYLDKSEKSWIKLFLHALTFPFLLLVIGFMLMNSIWLEKIYPTLGVTLNHANDLGSVCVLLSPILFLYLFTKSVFHEHAMYFIQKQNVPIAKIFSTIKNGLRIIFLLIAVTIIISAFQLKPAYYDFFYNMMIVISIAAMSWVLLQIFAIVEAVLYRKYQLAPLGSANRNMSASYTKIHIIRNIASFVIIIIGIAAALMVFDKVRNIGISLLASAGFVTALLALAAQKPLGSLFAGLQLALTEPLKLGDWVVIENESGTIEEITLTYVVIKIWDLRRLILPISYFIEKPFQSWSRGQEGLSNAIKLYVGYALPIEPIIQELNTIIKASFCWDKRVGSLAVSNFQEKCMELRINISAENPTNLDSLGNEVREQLLEFINQRYAECLPKPMGYIEKN